MSTFRHVVEHAVPLIFGLILGWLSLGFTPTHLEWWVPGFVILFLLYSTIFEIIKRSLLFRFGHRHAICGAYAELYPGPNGLVIAPFLVLHDLRSDQLRVLGRAFVLDAQGRIHPGANIGWKSTAIFLSEPDGETLELAYLFTGQKGGNYKIHGTTRVGVPLSESGDTLPRDGYFLDTDIKEPAFGRAGDKPYGPVEDLANRVDAIRFFSIKFDSETYGKFVKSCARKIDRAYLSLRFFCEPNEVAFRTFIEKAGLKFLDQHAPNGATHYQEIACILHAAAALAPVPDAAQAGTRHASSAKSSN